MTCRTNRLIACVSLIASLMTTAGCAGMVELAGNRKLEVSTQMSESIFLDPVEPEQQTIYVRVRNTSDQDFDLEPAVKQALERTGYQIVRSPSKARFRLQANILAIAKQDKDYAAGALAAGFGGRVGAAVGYGGEGKSYQQRRTQSSLLGAAGSFADLMSAELVEVPVYTIVTDIELVEKAPNGVFVRTDRQIDRKDGMGGRSTSTMSGVGKDIKYRTRIVSTATKANLELPEALPPLRSGIARSISGLF